MPLTCIFFFLMRRLLYLCNEKFIKGNKSTSALERGNLYFCPGSVPNLCRKWRLNHPVPPFLYLNAHETRALRPRQPLHRVTEWLHQCLHLSRDAWIAGWSYLGVLTGKESAGTWYKNQNKPGGEGGGRVRGEGGRGGGKGGR